MLNEQHFKTYHVCVFAQCTGCILQKGLVRTYWNFFFEKKNS